MYPRDQVILVEETTLLDEQPWSQLNLLFDYSIFGYACVLESRLIQRWLDQDPR